MSESGGSFSCFRQGCYYNYYHYYYYYSGKGARVMRGKKLTDIFASSSGGADLVFEAAASQSQFMLYYITLLRYTMIVYYNIL